MNTTPKTRSFEKQPAFDEFMKFTKVVIFWKNTREDWNQFVELFAKQQKELMDNVGTEYSKLIYQAHNLGMTQGVVIGLTVGITLTLVLTK